MKTFYCKNCGSSKLAYQKYIKSIVPIEIEEDDALFYSHSSFNEEDYLAISNGFCCGDCGHLIEHCGYNIESENQLVTYLTMDPHIQQQQEKDYHDYINAQSSTEEQRVREQEFHDQEVADMTAEIAQE